MDEELASRLEVLETLVVRQWLATLGAVPIRATIKRVARVKNVNGAPGKCEIQFLATRDNGKFRNKNPDGTESIETDWLSDVVATHIARVAQANKEQIVTLWKVNTPDPDGVVTQGFRQIAWIDAGESATARRAGNSASKAEA